jgi:hypothetical protein
MKITPRTEEEIKRRNLIDPGVYEFIVHEAKEKVSKTSGNPMIEVVLKVTDIYGKVHTLYDYLMDTEYSDYKIRHLSECSGCLDKYENGEVFASDFLGKKGKVKVTIRKDKKGEREDKNSVQDYIANKLINIDNFEDDSLPF